MKLNLIFLNDVHGYLEPHAELFYSNHEEYTDTAGGYAEISSVFKKIKNDNPNTLIFDGGDTFHGTLPVVDTKGQIVVPILSHLEIDAMVGHWDFGYGPDHLNYLMSQLNYPMLAINVYNDNDDSLFLDPYIIKEVENLKVGVLGICANIIDKVMPSEFSSGLYLTDGKEGLSHYIKEIKEQGADIIVLLSHNGYPQDVDILKDVEGVDVCLSAHTHNRLYESIIVNNTIIIQSGCHGSFVGNLELDIDNGHITSHNYELIRVDSSIQADPVLKELIQSLVSPYKYLKDNIVGETDHILHRYDTLNSSMDDFMLMAVKHIIQTEIAFSNGWRYGFPIPKRKITEMDLYNIVPMNPIISTIELSGKEIKNMLEKNLERTFSADPLEQMGVMSKDALACELILELKILQVIEFKRYIFIISILSIIIYIKFLSLPRRACPKVLERTVNKLI